MCSKFWKLLNNLQWNKMQFFAMFFSQCFFLHSICYTSISSTTRLCFEHFLSSTSIKGCLTLSAFNIERKNGRFQSFQYNICYLLWKLYKVACIWLLPCYEVLRSVGNLREIPLFEVNVKIWACYRLSIILMTIFQICFVLEFGPSNVWENF